jgi:Uma2 family endonuclease
MQSATLVSVQEYLSTEYEPDCDYVDGIIEQRNLGEWDHSRLQGLLIAYFHQREKQWRIKVVPEQRIRITATRFRVPDVTIIEDGRQESILTRAPLLCIEVLSPEDRMSRINARVQDYLTLGVPDVWIIDPKTRQCFTCTKAAGLHEVTTGVLTTTDGRITLTLAELGE